MNVYVYHMHNMYLCVCVMYIYGQGVSVCAECVFTVGVLVGQPVMFQSFMFKNWIPNFTLILPETEIIETVLCNTQPNIEE